MERKGRKLSRRFALWLMALLVAAACTFTGCSGTADGGSDADACQRQQQTDGSIGQHHQQHCRQTLGHMEYPGEKADGPAQHIGDQKRQDKGHQQGQHELQRHIAQLQ